jgi:signal transduction histidine kinase
MFAKLTGSLLNPKSKDKEVAFRERLVRYGLAIIMFNISFSLAFSLTHTGELLQNLIIHIPILAIEFFAIAMVGKGRINVAGQLLVLQIIVSQVAYMLYTRYTHNAMSYLMGPLSLIFAVLLAAALLPPRQIMPFTILIVASLMVAVFYPISPAWEVIEGYDPYVFGIWSGFILMVEGLALSKLMQESERRYYNEQKANQAKSEFLRHVNHELRTPLNSIVPLIQMVLESKDPLTEKQKTRLLRVKNGADYLFNLVASILNFSKIESGILEQKKKETDLNLLLEDCVTIIKPQISPRTTIVNELEPIPALNLDPMQMTEVFVNILGNAAKFTDEGFITMRSAIQPQSVIIEIEDTGAGISDESKVFEWFGQTLAGKAKHGSGLGMPIAKSLVEAHGGKMYFETRLNKGTRFFVELPRKAMS